MAVNLILNKEHLTIEGLRKIVAIRASMNWGLSSILKETYPNIVPVNREDVVNKEIPEPNWLAGFTSAEGCFMITVINSSSNRLGSQVLLTFQLTQHSRDRALMENMVEYLDCGKIYVDKELVYFKISKFLDLQNKVIPF
jgi:hypothetical protein